MSGPSPIDDALQRLEFAFELFWKAAKRLLSRDGLEASTPRDVLRAAYKAGWLTDEAAWLAMLDDRNTSSRVYDEATARRIYDSIGRNLPTFRAGVESLARRSDR
jgi:nucleotidyltransferase substrate binding protein (TIGR01987 family)